MAFALVGSAGAGTQGASGASVTPAYGQSPTAGNLLVLCLSITGGAWGGSAPSGWTNIQTAQATQAYAAIYARIATGGDAAPTVTGSTGFIIAAHLEEWSGGPTSAVADRSGSSTGTASPATATLSGANAAANELVVMAGADRRSVARATVDTWTSNHGTPTLQASNNSTSSTDHYSHATLISNSAAAADTAVMTLSIATSITGVAIVAASFLLAAAAATPSLVVPRDRGYRSLLVQ